MDFNFSPEDEAFRAEFRAWLDKNAPKGGLADADSLAEDNDDDWPKRLAWYKKLNQGGWVGIDWPKEYGGRGASILQTIVYRSEEHTSELQSPCNLVCR